MDGQVLCANCSLPFEPPLLPHSSAFIVAVHPGCVDKDELRAVLDGSGDFACHSELASYEQRRSASAASGDHRRGMRPQSRIEEEDARLSRSEELPARSWVKPHLAAGRHQGSIDKTRGEPSSDGSAVEEAGAQRWLSSRRRENGQERKDVVEGECPDDRAGEDDWADEPRRRSSWVSGDAQSEEDRRVSRFALNVAALQTAGRKRFRAGKEEHRLSGSPSPVSSLHSSSSSISSPCSSPLSTSGTSVSTAQSGGTPVLSRARGGHQPSTPVSPGRNIGPSDDSSEALGIDVDSEVIDEDEDDRSNMRSRTPVSDGVATRRRDVRRDQGDHGGAIAPTVPRKSIGFSPPEMGLHNLGLNGARLHLRCKFADSAIKTKADQGEATWQQIIEGNKQRQKAVAREAAILAELDSEREAMNKSFLKSQECLKSLIARLTHCSEIILNHHASIQTGEISCEKLSALNHQIHDLESLVRLTRVLDFDSSTLNNEINNVKKEIRLIEKNVEALMELRQQIVTVNKTKDELSEQLAKVEFSLSAVESFLGAPGTGIVGLSDPRYKFAVEPLRETFAACWNNLNQRLGKAEAEEFIYTISYETIMSKEEEKDTEDIRFIHTTGSPQIKAATGGRLIERLAYFKYTDLNFQKAFFLTYRYFLTPAEVLEKLAMRYCFTPPYNSNPDELALHIMQNSQSTVQLRVLTALKYWVENYWEDFQGDMIPLFRDMLELALPNKNQKIVTALRESFERRFQGIFRNGSTSLVRPPNTNMVTAKISQSLANATVLTFSDLEPVVVAQQLTLLEWDIYQRIEEKEFFKQSWTKARKEITSPNILNMIHTFNRISNWVAAEVVMTADFSQRCNKVKKFILTAMECYKLNNFNGALAVIAGLNNSSVHRLKRTWEQVTGIYMKVYEELMELMANNFAKFRNELRSAAPPCIPYLGIFLTDLTFIEDGNPDQIDGLINFHKLRQVAEKIREVRQYQNDFYNLESIPQVQLFLRTVKNYNDNEIYEQSLRLETRKLNKFFE